MKTLSTLKQKRTSSPQIIQAGMVAAFIFLISSCNGFFSYNLEQNIDFQGIESRYTLRNQTEFQVSVSEPIDALMIKIQKSQLPEECILPCFHALLIPENPTTLYHGHPYYIRPGAMLLPLPPLPKGNYNLWLEGPVYFGHEDVPFLQNFPLEMKEDSPFFKRNTENPHITIKPVELEFGSGGKTSHLKFLILVDGEPAQNFVSFVGVSVHSFILSEDGTYFRHDHAEREGDGIVDAHFKFPKPGNYFLFLQPSVETKDNKMIREVIRYPLVVK